MPVLVPERVTTASGKALWLFYYQGAAIPVAIIDDNGLAHMLDEIERLRARGDKKEGER